MGILANLLKCQGLADPTGFVAVRPVFIQTFREFGLPQAIRTDNGPPFATSALGGLSALSVDERECTDSNAIFRSEVLYHSRLREAHRNHKFTKKPPGWSDFYALASRSRPSRTPRSGRHLPRSRALGRGGEGRSLRSLPPSRRVKFLEHETETSVRIEPCFSPVWDTAIVAVANGPRGNSHLTFDNTGNGINSRNEATLALTAVMRKLIVLMNHLLKNPNFSLAH